MCVPPHINCPQFGATVVTLTTFLQIGNSGVSIKEKKNQGWLSLGPYQSLYDQINFIRLNLYNQIKS